MSATARTRTDGTKVISEAESTTQNVEIAGVLKIQSVVSTASAAVDGGKGTGEAVTTASGVSIADQPVTIDQNGLHLVDRSGTPLGAVANQIIQQALGASGMTITATAPTKRIEGGKVEKQAAYSLPAKLSVPLILCIFPVLVVVTLLPAFIRVKYGVY